jgi:hypothetical protein
MRNLYCGGVSSLQPGIVHDLSPEQAARLHARHFHFNACQQQVKTTLTYRKYRVAILADQYVSIDFQTHGSSVQKTMTQ